MTADVRRTTRNHVVVGRRPVFSSDLGVSGYALALAPGDAGTLTPEVLADYPGTDGGSPPLGALFGSKLAFVRPTAALLRHPEILRALLTPDATVVEVAAGDGFEPAVADSCRALVEMGFRLAVTDEAGGAEGATPPLLEVASYTKLDVGGTPANRLRYHAQRASELGLLSVATGVDHLDALGTARLAGFDLFQGYLLSRPAVVMTEALTPSRLTVLQMIEAVNDPGTSAADLQKVVEADAGLSYRLLHISSLGAAGGLRRPVHSIKEATVLLGRDWIYRWLILMLVADANQGVPEQLVIAMTRARMAELVAAGAGLVDKDAAFTVGLLSALDLVLGAPLADIVAKLAVTEDVVEALLEGKGRLGAVLHDVLRWEVGDAAGSSRSGLDRPALEWRYVTALDWAQGLVETLERADRAA